jgi:hypothetical protein
MFTSLKLSHIKKVPSAFQSAFYIISILLYTTIVNKEFLIISILNNFVT